MSEESNCVRCNKHPKKAGESVCKVCYGAGSGYFDIVGNDLADYFEWPDDEDAEEFGADSRVMNEELMEAIRIVFWRHNIRDEREQLKELMFIYGALEEEMYMGAEEFGAEGDDTCIHRYDRVVRGDTDYLRCDNCGGIIT